MGVFSAQAHLVWVIDLARHMSNFQNTTDEFNWGVIPISLGLDQVKNTN